MKRHIAGALVAGLTVLVCEPQARELQAQRPAAVALRASTSEGKLRVFVLTDIGNEPDDAQSMVRFLVYANHFDVEGLVATTSVHQRDQTSAWRIREILAAYGKVRDNLAEARKKREEEMKKFQPKDKGFGEATPPPPPPPPKDKKEEKKKDG